MHYHMEVIMPPTDNVNASLDAILDPFYEGAKEPSHAFWDWWEIGGRWSGAKQEARLPHDKLEQFRQWLTDEGITVSGLQFGKHELSPATQIPKVDAKWQEMFNIAGSCTIFRHSNATDHMLDGDICLLKDIPIRATASRVIIAGPAYEGGVAASYMIEQSYWNGVCHIDASWDGTLQSAISMGMKHMQNYADAWREAHTPKENWLVVTVDYHS